MVLQSCLVVGVFGFGCAIEDSPDVDVSSDSQEILGGTAVSVGQFPTVVAVVVDLGRRGMCTGTLVGPDTVLTAAHCVNTSVLGYATQEQLTADTVVVFDATNLNGGQLGPTRQAAATIPNPNWFRAGDPDVGLVRLTQSITDRTPSPINLNAANAPIGVSVTMVGYGVTGGGGGGGVGMFLENKVTSSCAAAGSSDATFLCYNQQDGTGKCSGDSGGPSFADVGGNPHTVVGITSFGDQNCQFFGADMRTDAARDFLAQHAPELLCSNDGFCEDNCGSSGAPVDPDCSDCEVDDDCENDDEFCNSGFCTPKPHTPGGVGSPCGDGEPDCASGICATGPDGMRCTDLCDLGGSDCPADFDCISAGDTGACWPAEGGGGCRTGGSPAAPATLALLCMALVLARRRRHR